MKLISSLFFFCFILNTNAQSPTCDCKADLDFLYEELIESKAYKSQKKNIESDFKASYQKLKASINREETPVFDCYILLNRLLLPIKDRHTEIYGNTTSVAYSEFDNEAILADFKASETNRIFPKSTLAIDSLSKELSTKKREDLEGVYYYGKYLKIGVYKTSDKTYRGVVLKSTLYTWERGDVILNLYNTINDRYQFVTGTHTGKKLISASGVIKNGQFLKLGYKKDTTTINYYKPPYPDHNYELSIVASNTQYIKLGSFGSYGNLLKEADAFAEKISNKLTAENIIVDLRDNTGGGERNSKQFYKLLKKFVRNGNLYVLVNGNTRSAAEQFLLKVSELPNVTVLGDNTAGALSYGWNSKTQVITPSEYFVFHPTDIDNSQFLEYEVIGVSPDIYLDNNEDWISQTLKFINH